MENQIYLVQVDEKGKVISGTSVPYDPGYIQVSQEIYENAERAFYVSGEWVIYDPLILDIDISEPITAGNTFYVTATLPEGSPDTEVTFSALLNGQHKAEPVTVQVSAGRAVCPIKFDVAGYYIIIASSEHHGSAAVGVSVVSA